MRRSPYQAMAAVMTLFVTFLFGGVFFLTTLVSVLTLQYFEGKPQMIVFFSEKSGDTEVQSLKKTLEATGSVASVKYVSKEEALTLYQKENKNDPLLLEMVTADILPASLEVIAKEPQLLKELEPIIQKSPGVSDIVFAKDVVDRLIAWTNGIRLVGGVLGLILLINSLLIVMTVITMKIAIRKDEIETLRLIGASKWYIRWPFIFEGASYGMLGGFLSWLAIAGILLWFQPNFAGFLGSIPSLDVLLADPLAPPFLILLAVQLVLHGVVGWVIGSIGSLFAVGRYLKL